MKIFEETELEIIEFEDDVITASTGGGGCTPEDEIEEACENEMDA